MLDQYLSAELRTLIEQRYYARINEQSRLEVLLEQHALDFATEKPVAFYSDHGVVHVRDVARQILQVLDRVHGVLIPHRSPRRRTRMKGYGVIVAYLHDIGMFDFTEFGRAMHPEFAARAVFAPNLDDVVTSIWTENEANLAWHLTSLAADGTLEQPPEIVLREMLALSIAHSKSKVPITHLNEPRALRALMLTALRRDLRELYLIQKRARLERRLADRDGAPPSDELIGRVAAIEAELAALEPAPNDSVDRFYGDFEREAFAWLISDSAAVTELRADVIDTLRALRCADALRQRGTLLTTSGGYEIFVDQRTANPLFGLRLGDDRLFLLELAEVISAGEANLASSELDPACDFRVSFHRGAFSDTGATENAVRCAAYVIDDIRRDVIESFVRPAEEPPGQVRKRADEMRLLLEETDDDLAFVDRVRARLRELTPEMDERTVVVPSLELAAERERERYLDAGELAWDAARRAALLERVGASGHIVTRIDPERAFRDCREISLQPGMILVEAGEPAVFVYIPLGEGLRVIPASGTASFAVQPWMPLGATGVIRGATRNATIRAEGLVHLLMIPRTTYLKHWHRTHTLDSLRTLLAAARDRR